MPKINAAAAMTAMSVTFKVVFILYNTPDKLLQPSAPGPLQCSGWKRRKPVSYTHLDVYKRQVPQMYLIDSALELRLCFNSPPFGRFYDQIYKEPKLRALFQSKVLDSLHMSSRVNAMGAEYFTFACLSISAIKPALVSFYLNPGGEKYSPDSYIPVSYTHLDVYKRQAL